MNLKELLKRIQNNPEAASIDLERYLDDFVPEKLLKNSTLQESFGINRQEMELLYYEAYQAYQKDLYQDSFELFRWLTILNPLEKRYWMGLSAANQLTEKYEDALKGYAVAYLLDTNDPLPHYYAFECYQHLGDRSESKKALELAYEKARLNPLHQSLKANIEQKLSELAAKATTR